MGLFGKSEKIDPAEQCTKCGKAVGDKLMQGSMLRKYGKNPDKLLLIATGMTVHQDPLAIGAGGFVCSKCHKKYCGNCGERLEFICCGEKVWIGTHYLL
jgi:hypothetical protein